MDCSPPDSSARGDSPGKNTGVGCHTLLQGSSQLRNWTQIFCIAGGFFTIWPPGKPKDGCESWIIKKAEWWRTDAFELWCWRKLLRVPWTTRSSNQSILKKVDPECSLEGLMLKLKAPILWPPDVKTWLIRKKTCFWKRLKAGREGDNRGWDSGMALPTQWTWVWASSRRWWRTGKPAVLQSLGSQSDKIEQLNNNKSHPI